MKEFVAARRRAAAAARQAKRIERRAAKLREREAAAARGEEGGDAGGEAGEAGGAAAARTAADAAAPLHRLEYAAQLEQKQHFVEKALRRLPREMQAAAHRVVSGPLGPPRVLSGPLLSCRALSGPLGPSPFGPSRPPSGEISPGHLG
uniref:Uncharacterized protein n=2 Tax=Emiliania huxleyi TaxID=2903 RepID=A0A7S3X2X9_EMIHU